MHVYTCAYSSYPAKLSLSSTLVQKVLMGLDDCKELKACLNYLNDNPLHKEMQMVTDQLNRWSQIDSAHTGTSQHQRQGISEARDIISHE